MNRTLAFCLTATLLLSTVHRAPAPISEVETPTPAPKRAIKHNTGEDSQRTTKRQTPSPTPKTQTTRNRNPFDGTWVGFDDWTLFINGVGTSVTQKHPTWGTSTWPATCDGSTLRWTGGTCPWTFTPNPDGKTAMVTASCPGFLGVGSGSWSGVARRTSP